MTILSHVFGRPLAVVVSIALLAIPLNVPAAAQDNHVQQYGEKDKDETQTEKSAKKEAERAYQRSLGNIPAQKATDPWGITRGDESQPKSAAKSSAKPKAAAKNEAKTNEAKSNGAAKQ